MRCRLLVALFFCSAVVVATARCAGCSEECAGQRHGSESCPCQTDQDCTTVGAILLCTNGTCTQGEPPDARAPDQCDTDAECASTDACAADGTCQPAPKCQRLEPGGALVSRVSDAPPLISAATVAARQVADAPQADCGMQIDVADPPLSATGYLTRDGDLVAAGCTGHWYAAHRAGFIECGGVLAALSAQGVTTCIGLECATGSCRELGAEMGVCP